MGTTTILEEREGPAPPRPAPRCRRHARRGTPCQTLHPPPTRTCRHGHRGLGPPTRTLEIATRGPTTTPLIVPPRGPTSDPPDFPVAGPPPEPPPQRPDPPDRPDLYGPGNATAQAALALSLVQLFGLPLTCAALSLVGLRGPATHPLLGLGAGVALVIGSGLVKARVPQSHRVLRALTLAGTLPGLTLTVLSLLKLHDLAGHPGSAASGLTATLALTAGTTATGIGALLVALAHQRGLSARCTR